MRLPRSSNRRPIRRPSDFVHLALWLLTCLFSLAWTASKTFLSKMAGCSPELRVIQCKYWRQEKTIHEKHIFQLFGSALEYAFRLGTFDDLRQLSLFGGPIKATGATAVLYTSAKISDVAKDVAKKLNVECHEAIGISDYPLVKCNINRGEQIYHLPFDQQYDRTKIVPDKGEKYVYTVAEAEQAGFRRAWKWRPQQGAS
jgi:hypothetical protein